MYIPNHFRESRHEQLFDLIRSHPLSTLVICEEGGLDANHLPLVVNGGPEAPFSLLGHIARQNSWVRFAAKRVRALAIFHGPSGYVSPSWYPEKHQHGRVVPTWNYMTVHAHGELVFHDDVDWLADQVTKMTTQQEIGMESPWQVSDAPSEYISKRLQQIVGIELVVDKLEGKWKLSQNQSMTNRQGVIQGLTTQGNSEMATAMYRSVLPHNRNDFEDARKNT